MVNENQCLLQRLGCIPMSNYRGMKDHLLFYKNNKNKNNSNNNEAVSTYKCSDDVNLKNQLTLRNANESLPFCFMHFQGREHKEIMYVYSKAIELSLLGCDGAAQTQPNTTSLVVSSRKQLYELQHGRKRPLSWEDYLKLSNASGLGIIKSVPFEVVEFFLE